MKLGNTDGNYPIISYLTLYEYFNIGRERKKVQENTHVAAYAEGHFATYKNREADSARVHFSFRPRALFFLFLTRPSLSLSFSHVDHSRLKIVFFSHSNITNTFYIFRCFYFVKLIKISLTSRSGSHVVDDD